MDCFEHDFSLFFLSAEPSGIEFESDDYSIFTEFDFFPTVERDWEMKIKGIPIQYHNLQAFDVFKT